MLRIAMGRIALSAFLFAGTVLLTGAQDQQQPGQVSNRTTTVHGVVRVSTGEPLPHALVRINGDASTGVLTDGDGRFEIADVPEGQLDFTVTKPGFLDEAEAAADSMAWNSHGYGHNVIAAPEIGDVTFIMKRVNSIRGQIQLSTGDVAEGIQVTLLRRTVQDGRAVWQIVGNARTNSEGVYRFGELPDGLYAVYSMPAMDSDTATNLVETGAANHVAREGYASMFFPDARDLASAAKIRLTGGEQAQANISLALEPFQPVVANVTMPRVAPGSDNVSIQVLDAQGHLLPYSAQYDAATHTVQALLPDGTYSFVASRTTNMLAVVTARNAETLKLPMALRPIAGAVSFAVAGHAVSNLRLPMSPSGSSSIEVSLAQGSNGASQQGDPKVFVSLSQTGGWMADGMVSSYAEGSPSGPLETTSPSPGSYWVHTTIGPKVFCEASFTAGGASLAREPLVLGIAGTTAPMVLALRDDCAKLTLSLPPSVGLSVGMEREYTVYVVPDFDSTEDVVPQTLRPSTGGRVTLTGMTPGNYHVYAFERPVALEYRNPAVLAARHGQPITVAPDGETELTIEVPQR